MKKRCDFCGANLSLVFVHGHYQCSRCHQVCITCCEGDFCDVDIETISKYNQSSKNSADNRRRNSSVWGNDNNESQIKRDGI